MCLKDFDKLDDAVKIQWQRLKSEKPKHMQALLNKIVNEHVPREGGYSAKLSAGTGGYQETIKDSKKENLDESSWHVYLLQSKQIFQQIVRYTTNVLNSLYVYF